MTKYNLEPLAASQQVVPHHGARQADQPIEFSEYVEVVAHHRALVAAIAITVALLGSTYAILKPPQYEGNMLIHVADTRPGETRPLFGHSAVPSEIKTAVSEIEVLRSRRVIEPVVERLGLHIEAYPKYFPVLGPVIAKRNRVLSEPGLFGHGGYCWGGERIKVGAFEVPDTLMNLPFDLTAGPGGQYWLRERTAGIVQSGMVGVPLVFQTLDGPVKLLVTELLGRSGAQFVVRRTQKVAAIEGVQGAMTVAELGKLSGMIGVTLKAANPAAVYTVLGEIGREYMAQNQSQKSIDAARSLALLEAQLPAMKGRMEAAEASYNDYRNRHGTADFTEETRLQLQRQSAGEQRLLDLEQKRNELGAQLGSAHPTMAALAGQIRSVREETNAIGAHLRTLPGVSQELERRARDVKATTELYSAVQRNVEDLRVVALDKSTNVRLVDAPVTPVRSAESRSLIIGFSVLLGIALGIAGAFVRRMMDR